MTRSLFAVLPFGGGASEPFGCVSLEVVVFDNPLVVDPSLYTSCGDDILVLAVPHP